MGNLGFLSVESGISFKLNFLLLALNSFFFSIVVNQREFVTGIIVIEIDNQNLKLCTHKHYKNTKNMQIQGNIWQSVKYYKSVKSSSNSILNNHLSLTIILQLKIQKYCQHSFTNSIALIMHVLEIK